MEAIPHHSARRNMYSTVQVATRLEGPSSDRMESIQLQVLLTMGCEYNPLTFLPQLDSVPISEIRLPDFATCITCDECVTMARELPLARRVWELLSPIKVNPDAVNAERHMSSTFQIDSPGIEPHELFNYSSYTAGLSENGPLPLDAELPMPPHSRRMTIASTMDQSSNMSIGPSYSNTGKNYSLLAHIKPWATVESFPSNQDMPSEINPGSSHSQQGSDEVAGMPYFSIDTFTSSRKQSITELSSLASPKSPKPVAIPDKARPRWKVPRPFTSVKRPLPTESGETSSLSSNQIDEQPVEEISLKGLFGSGLKTSAKTKAVANVHVTLSQNSSYALLWSQFMIHVWDVSTSPPSLARTIPTESTCILAAVGKRYVAYVVGSRDQRLTVRC